MTFVDRNDERFYEAELHRLKGELLLSTPADPSGAERSFRLALEIAERHKAKSLGLRAALSLARLCAREADNLKLTISSPHLRLVQGGLRHPRSQGGQGTARRTARIGSVPAAITIGRAVLTRSFQPRPPNANRPQLLRLKHAHRSALQIHVHRAP